MQRLLLLLCVVFIYTSSFAQDDNALLLNTLNAKRMSINKTANITRGVYSVANIGVGVAGFISAEPTSGWKTIHATNAAVGVVEGLITLGSMSRARNAYNSDFSDAWNNYNTDLNQYKTLIYFDIGLMVVGTATAIFGPSMLNGEDYWSYAGVSLAAQGVALIILDGIVYAMHNSKSYKWVKLMKSIRASGNSVGMVYNF